MPPRSRSSLHARIGRRVRELRTDRRMTQAELAAAIGRSNHFVSGIERGVDSPSLDTLEALAAALDTSVGALVAEEKGASGASHDLARLLEQIDDPRLAKVLRDVAVLYRGRRK